MSSFKTIDLLRDFAAGVYLSEAQNPVHSPPPLHTVYVYTLYEQNTYSHREGGES
jgi:hypothetical protein